MAKDTTELANAVLKRLRQIGALQTAKAQDSQDVIDYYNSEYERLRRKDIAYWSKTSIRDEVFNPLVDYIAGKIAPNYGMSRPDLHQSGEIEIRDLSSVNKLDLKKRAKADYF